MEEETPSKYIAKNIIILGYFNKNRTNKINWYKYGKKSYVIFLLMLSFKIVIEIIHSNYLCV